jgi:hypothetical protein
MARIRWIRLAAIASAATMAWSVPFAVWPAASSAHRLTKRQATREIRYLARQIAARQTDVIDHVAGACERRTQHAFRCTYFLKFSDGDICGQRVLIFYRSHASRRLSHRAVSRLSCGL